MRPWRITALFALSLLAIAQLAPAQHESDAIDLQPRPDAIKPAETTVRARHRPDRVSVKLRDDLPARLQRGVMTGLDAPQLDALNDTIAPFGQGAWHRAFDLPTNRLDAMRTKAQRSLRKEVADLATYFEYEVPQGADPSDVIDALNALPFVELAQPMPRPAPPTVPGDFTNQQGYAHDPPTGTDAWDTWDLFGFRGQGVRVCDVEYAWNENHQDLPNVTLIGAPGQEPFGNQHGTAVIGQMGSLDNGFGTTGIAPDAQYYFAPALVTSYNPGAAIIRALNVLEVGDVILIEQQISGPNGGSNYVPIEWFRPYYDAIVTAVGNGVTVVEAAGNGGQNLDAPEFQTGNGGHYPFLPENDSGAIIVGAGSSGSQSRLSFSCYGQTVDLQGWGQNVTTTGYGGLYSAEGPDLFYTSTFSGTSSASPIVAGAVALLQSTYKNLTGVPLSPDEVRDALRATGTPQGGNTTQNIGPLPNVPPAIAFALGDAEGLLPLLDDFETDEIDTLNWPINDDATISDAATNEPSGTRSLRIMADTGRAASARLQARLSDDITLAYARQLQAGADLTVEWLHPEDGFTQLARHTNTGATESDFTTNEITLPPEASYDGLRVRFLAGETIPGAGDAFVDDVSITGVPALPRPFELLTPVDGATEVATSPTYNWTDSELFDTYRLIVDDDEDLSSPTIDTNTDFSLFSNPGAILQPATQYYWKVQAINANGPRDADPGVATFFTVGFEQPCPGDCTGDGNVTFDDLTCMLFRFNSSSATQDTDCDGDGAITFNDLTCALFSFGECE